MITLNAGEHAQHVVDPVAEHRLVRALEALDDLLEVLEHVPDALVRVDDVVEVDVLGDEAPRPLEVAQGGALRPDDLAEVDDLLLDVGDVADDVLAGRSSSKISSSIRSSLLPIFASMGNDASTQSSTIGKQVAGALAEQLSRRSCRDAALEEVLAAGAARWAA
jgi:hypothetical protein